MMGTRPANIQSMTEDSMFIRTETGKFYMLPNFCKGHTICEDHVMQNFPVYGKKCQLLAFANIGLQRHS